MRRLPDAGHDNYCAITDKQSRVLLTAIRLLLDKFEPIGDDYRHGLWIEVPRETYWYYLSMPMKSCRLKEKSSWHKISVASYEHVSAGGLRFARDADSC